MTMDEQDCIDARNVIIKSMEHKSILITGSTGFLAKIFVEEVLRNQPQVKKLYLLMRAQDNISAVQRFQEQVIIKEVFNILREVHGEDFDNFISSKVVPLDGDISLKNLGIGDSKLEQEMFKEIEFIVNVAANTNFDERYDVALRINTFGAKHIFEFAKNCKKLELLLHVSTAYVTKQNEGLIFEIPVHMDETFKKISTPLSLIEMEMQMVEERLKKIHDKKTNEKAATISMKEFGLQRARMHGWWNTYVFTKAMGEMILGQLKRENNDVPLVIVRPPIITSTYKQPFSGWIEGFKTIDAFFHNYSKGKMTHFLANPHSKMDVIPGDMVVNLMIAALTIFRHSQLQHDVIIYHVCTSSRNPVTYIQLGNWAFEYLSKNPNLDHNGKPIKVARWISVPTLAKFSRYTNLRYLLPLKAFGIVNFLCFNCFESGYNKFNREYKRMMRLLELYEPYVLFKGTFDNSNLEKLGASLKEEQDQKDFNFDPKCINWEDYFMNVHFPGIIKHVFK